MTDHPIDDVIVDGEQVPKADTRSYFKDRTRLRVRDVTEVRSSDFSDAFGIDLNGQMYDKDTGDTTSIDDGVTVIIDVAGNVFKISSAIMGDVFLQNLVTPPIITTDSPGLVHPYHEPDHIYVVPGYDKASTIRLFEDAPHNITGYYARPGGTILITVNTGLYVLTEKANATGLSE